jgi:hypothetical protein
MKPSEEPRIVSLETHRRRRQAEGRQKSQKKKAQPRPPVFGRQGHAERAINWRRVPLFAGLVILFMALSWLISHIATLLPLS